MRIYQTVEDSASVGRLRHWQIRTVHIELKPSSSVSGWDQYVSDPQRCHPVPQLFNKDALVGSDGHGVHVEHHLAFMKGKGAVDRSLPSYTIKCLRYDRVMVSSRKVHPLFKMCAQL